MQHSLPSMVASSSLCLQNTRLQVTVISFALTPMRLKSNNASAEAADFFCHTVVLLAPSLWTAASGSSAPVAIGRAAERRRVRGQKEVAGAPRAAHAPGRQGSPTGSEDPHEP